MSIIAKLLVCGADVNFSNASGDTALSRAVENNQPRIIELLLCSGADVNYANDARERRTVLFDAVRAIRPDIVAQLLRHGADGNFRDDEDQTAIHLAVEMLESVDNANVNDLFDVIKALIPHHECLDRFYSLGGENATSDDHEISSIAEIVSPFVECLGIELRHWPKDLELTKCFLRHGVIADPEEIFEMALEYVPNRHCEFFSLDFFRLMRRAGVDLTSFEGENYLDIRWSHSNGQLDRLYDELATPLSLQCLVVMRVRQHLGGYKLWGDIDQLPLPDTLKDVLKLKV